MGRKGSPAGLFPEADVFALRIGGKTLDRLAAVFAGMFHVEADHHFFGIFGTYFVGFIHAVGHFSEHGNLAGEFFLAIVAARGESRGGKGQ